MHCGRKRILSLTQNAHLEKRAWLDPMPKRKRNFDVFPIDSLDNSWKEPLQAQKFS